MRIQRTNFLLTLTLKHSDDKMSIDVYDCNFEPMPITRKIKDNNETVEILSYLPNKVMLVLSGKNNQSNDKSSIELLNMTIAGIKINQNIMLNRTEYKPILSTQVPDSIQEYLDYPSTCSITWNHNGCVLFDLFDPDPFAYLLKIGNRIKF
jgi:hypothetical protein